MGTKLEVAKKVKYAVLYTNGMIRVDEVIGSYPHILKKQDAEGDGVAKYSYQGLMPKDTHREAIALIRDVMKRIMTEKNLQIPASKLFMKDGDKFFEEKPECKNRYVITAREERRPTIRNEKAEKLDPHDDADKIADMFYGGSTVSLLINPWVQNNSYGKRINANLRAVLFVRHGEPFGQGRIDDEEIWETAEGDDDDDGFDDDDDI